MNDLRSLALAGDLWRVEEPIVANTTTVLVTPKPQRPGPVNINNQPTTATHNGITILGWSLSVTSGGALEIELRAGDAVVAAGSTVDDPVKRWYVPSGVTIADSAQCTIGLMPAHYAPTPKNGSTLELVVNNQTVTGGFITVWGIHGQLELGGRRSWTSSPADYSTGFGF